MSRLGWGEHGLYTSHGLMTPADLAEYREDTDWHELNRRPQQDDECVHGRYRTDDCEACGRPDDEPSGCLRRLVPALLIAAAQAAVIAVGTLAAARGWV